MSPILLLLLLFSIPITYSSEPSNSCQSPAPIGGFLNLLLSGFTSFSFGLTDLLMKHTKKLPNVCERKLNFTMGGNGTNWIGKTISVQKYKDAYVTTKPVELDIFCPHKNGTRKFLECCVGYTTDDIMNAGCDKEVNDQLLSLYGLSLSVIPQNSTYIFSKPEQNPYTFPGILNVYELIEKKVLRTELKEQLVVRSVNNGHSNRIYLNCAFKNQTFRTETSVIHRFEGNIGSASDNVLDIIGSNPNLSIFYNILGDELRTVLRETDEATIFAFTNEAFEKLSESTKKQMLNGKNDQCVKEAMKRHFTTKASYCDSALDSKFESENENLFDIQNTPTLKIGNATIVIPSLPAVNGIVHIIDKAFVDENFLSWIHNIRNFNPNLADALENEHINETITVLIPPRDSQINDPKNYILLENSLDFMGRRIKTVAGSKIVSQSKITISLSMRENGIRIAENATMDKLSAEFGQIGCSRFTAEPIRSCNAQLYFIDKPLPMVKKSIKEYLASRADLSAFYRVWTLSSERIKDGLTVFVTPNSAFLHRLNSIGTKEDIDVFMKRHVSQNMICSFDFEEGSKYFNYTSIGGNILSLTSENGIARINGTRIQESEIVLSDGVIHILEAPISLPSELLLVTPTDPPLEKILEAPISSTSKQLLMPATDAPLEKIPEAPISSTSELLLLPATDPPLEKILEAPISSTSKQLLMPATNPPLEKIPVAPISSTSELLLVPATDPPLEKIQEAPSFEKILKASASPPASEQPASISMESPLLPLK